MKEFAIGDYVLMKGAITRSGFLCIRKIESNEVCVELWNNIHGQIYRRFSIGPGKLFKSRVLEVYKEFPKEFLI